MNKAKSARKRIPDNNKTHKPRNMNPSRQKVKKPSSDLAWQLTELQIVREISNELLKPGGSPDKSALVAVNILKKIPEYDYTDIFLIDKATGKIIPLYSGGSNIDSSEFDEKIRSALLSGVSETGLHVGVGLTGWSAATRKTIIADRVSREPRYIAYRRDTNSEICVPLKLPDGRVIGLINVESRRPAAFGDKDRRLLETISALVASALENSLMYESACRRAAILSAINRSIIESETSRADLPAFLENILENVLKAFSLKTGILCLTPSPAGKEPTFTVYRGLPQNFIESHVRPRLDELKKIDKTLAFSRSDEFGKDMAAAVRKFGIESAVVIPMKMAAGRIGILAVFSPVSRIWSSDEITLLESMTTQVALAVEKSLLDEKIKRRLLDLESINAVSSAMRTASNKEELLPLLLDKTLEALQTDSGSIWLYDRESNLLRSMVSRGWFKNLDIFSSSTPDRGVSAMVFKTKKPHIMTEFSSDPLILEERRKLIPKGWSGAIIPISFESKVWGGMSLSLPDSRQFTPGDLKLLESLADMAGTALYRMHLLEETTRRLSSLQSLHAIGRAIVSSLDINMTLDFILD